MIPPDMGSVRSTAPIAQYHQRMHLFCIPQTDERKNDCESIGPTSEVGGSKKFWGFDVTLSLDPLPLLILCQVIGFGVHLPPPCMPPKNRTFHLNCKPHRKIRDIETVRNCKSHMTVIMTKRPVSLFLLLGELKIIIRSI